MYTDGWCSSYCAYTYFVPHQKGTLEVSLSRTAYNGTAPAGHITLEVGGVVLDENHNPVLGRVFKRVHTVLPNTTQQTIDIPVSETPVRVEVRTTNASLIPPQPSDSRTLGAQLSFKFVPS